MKALIALLFAFVAASVVVGAEDNRLVKVYTLNDGNKIVALHSIQSTANGKTTYHVTEPGGKKATFDSTQVARVDEEKLSQAMASTNGAGSTPATRPSNVEPYTGPNLGLAADSGTRSGYGSGGGGWWGGMGGYLGSTQAVLTRNGLTYINPLDNSNNGPVIGLRNSGNAMGSGNGSLNGVPANWNATLGQGGSMYFPNTPQGYAASIASGWNASLAQAGGVYIPNTAAGYAQSIAGGYNATLAQAGGTYVPWNATGGTIAANPNWPYTGDYYNTLNKPGTIANASALSTAQIMANAGSHFVPNNAANTTGTTTNTNTNMTGGTCSNMTTPTTPSTNNSSSSYKPGTTQTATHTPTTRAAIRPSSTGSDHVPTYSAPKVTALPQLKVPPNQPQSPAHFGSVSLSATHGTSSGLTGASPNLKR